MGYLIATDHFPADGTADISSALQTLIDANPSRTIFFPDGTYLLSKPVLTPADPHKSVDLILSKYAHRKRLHRRGYPQRGRYASQHPPAVYHPIIRQPSHDQYEKSVGFRVGENMANWLDYCYSDQFATGYHVHKGAILQNCFCWWYSGKETSHVALRSALPFAGMANTLVIGGEQHPEHPNSLEDGLVLSENGVIPSVNLNGTTIRSFGEQEA